MQILVSKDGVIRSWFVALEIQTRLTVLTSGSRNSEFYSMMPSNCKRGKNQKRTPQSKLLVCTCKLFWFLDIRVYVYVLHCIWILTCTKQIMYKSLLILQKGPRFGTDKVKKGGSYMCHKVRQIICTIVHMKHAEHTFISTIFISILPSP